MKLRVFAIIAMLAIAAMFGVKPCAAQKRDPSTPEERGRAVNLTRFLEADPLNEKAPEARRWLMAWLGVVPDISVPVCQDFLKPLMQKDTNYSTELFAQSLYGSATFIIEHPDDANNYEAMYLAGVESTLRAYEFILKTKPKAKWPFLDELIEKRERGELDDYVREVLSKGKCKK
ncbi:MAG: hypothetical protein ICV60_12485 [Pyrinomonadaceae bacterium]|nr:hypothetical protein [Pyrinomonadaceae bacterium]